MDIITNGVLPPCRICGGKASGFHYGANTCEACKAFFRRGLDKAHIYECAGHRCCEISYRKRGTCAYCRFQKCLRIGMCKDAIKPGRYSHEKKASNIKEVKALLAQIERESKPNQSNCSPAQVTSQDKLTSTSDLCSDYGSDCLSVDQRYEYNRDSRSDFSGCVTPGSSGQGSVSENIEQSPQNPLSCDVLNMCVTSVQSACVSDVPSAFALNQNDSTINSVNRHQVLYDKTKIELYESIIKEMHLKHKIYANDDADLGDTLSEPENECLEMFELRRQIFGSMNPMSLEEYKKFYDETGIDVDGRLELLQEVLPRFDQCIKLQIAFAKTIPGFNMLSLNDQISLIKAGRFESSTISRHRRFNPQYKLYSMYNGKIIHMEDLRKLKGEYVEPLFKLEHKVRNLNLRKDETAVLSALCIMCAADTCELENRPLVEQSQDFLLECLFYLFDKFHQGEQLLFAKVIDSLIELRSLREESIKNEEQFMTLWYGMIDFPPLLCELYEISRQSQ